MKRDAVIGWDVSMVECFDSLSCLGGCVSYIALQNWLGLLTQGQRRSERNDHTDQDMIDYCPQVLILIFFERISSVARIISRAVQASRNRFRAIRPSSAQVTSRPILAVVKSLRLSSWAISPQGFRRGATRYAGLREGRWTRKSDSLERDWQAVN